MDKGREYLESLTLDEQMSVVVFLFRNGIKAEQDQWELLTGFISMLEQVVAEEEQSTFKSTYYCKKWLAKKLGVIYSN